MQVYKQPLHKGNLKLVLDSRSDCGDVSDIDLVSVGRPVPVDPSNVSFTVVNRKQEPQGQACRVSKR